MSNTRKQDLGNSYHVPTYQTLMLPLLKFAGDKEEHTFNEALEAVARSLNLSDESIKELLPSGTERRYNNRLRWAQKYLREAGLLEKTGRGFFKISDIGISELSLNPKSIDDKYLLKFPEFLEFVKRSQPHKDSNEKDSDVQVLSEIEQAVSPVEAVETLLHQVQTELENEILERVKSCPPSFFEQLIVDLMIAMGYGGSIQDAGKAIGRSGDGGIDGIIKEDKLGLEVIYLQAKRWQGSVGGPVVQAFAGSLEGHKAKKGVIVTTSTFTTEAYRFVQNIEKRIILIDGINLSKLMIEHGVGVKLERTYQINKLDDDYFAE